MTHQHQMDRAFLIKFILSMVGSEEDLVAQLENENPKAVYFKVLGKYDILEISKLNALHEAIRLNSDPRILEINCFPCFCWHGRLQDFWENVASSISPTITLIKLQEPVLRNRGLYGVDGVAKYLCSLNDSLFALSGMGYYEIILMHPSDNFENIFSFIEEIRKLRIVDVFPLFAKRDREKALFANTITIPLISYHTVIKSQNWQKLKGNVTPVITIKCAPGHEDFIPKQWSNSWKNLLGVEDLICLFGEPTPSSTFIKDLMVFRKNAGKSLSVFDTKTQLFHSRPTKPSTAGQIAPPEIEKPPFWLFEKLKTMEQTIGVKQFIISEIINIVSLINTYIGKRALKFTYSDILYSIKYLNWLISEYEKAGTHKNLANIARLEDYLLCYADSVRSAITQHFPGEDYGDSPSLGTRQSYDCSLSIIIRAISVIPEQLFRIIANASPPAKLAKFRNSHSSNEGLTMSLSDFMTPWKGFIFLTLSENYQLLDQGERFCIPYKDIFCPLNWLTLSHEIAHAYYVRIDFEFIEKDYIDNWKEVVDKTHPELMSDYISNRLDSYFEFFAHWFDYRHFFNRDFNFYLWSIWRTWLDIPRVYQFKQEYWLRSLFVKLCHSWMNLKPEFERVYHGSTNKLDREAGYIKLFERPLNEVIDFIQCRFPNRYKSIALLEVEKKEVLEKMLLFFDLCRKFEEKYVILDIINVVEKPYSKLERDIELILAGKVVKSRIENPFLLLREMLRRYYKENQLGDLPDHATVAFIYSFWQISRHFRRPLRSLR